MARISVALAYDSAYMFDCRSDSDCEKPLLDVILTPPDSVSISPVASDCEALYSPSSSSSTEGNDDFSVPQKSFLARAATHIVARLGRTVKSANWPLFIAFSSCVVILFRALSGQGYVPPVTSAVPSLLVVNASLPPPLPAFNSESSDNTNAWDIWRKLIADVKADMETHRESWVGPDDERRGRGRKQIGETGFREWWKGEAPRPSAITDAWEGSVGLEEATRMEELREDAEGHDGLEEEFSWETESLRPSGVDDGTTLQLDSGDKDIEVEELG